ncbi:MAG: winged helix-turn-helix domain-containing protein [Acetobacteraceae bacterium]
MGHAAPATPRPPPSQAATAPPAGRAPPDTSPRRRGWARDWLLEATSHRETEAFDRAIDLRITRLRRKIEHDRAHPNAIRTVRGVGYMFVPPRG